MPSKTKRRLSGATRASSATQAEPAETKVADSARHEKIRIRAYEIYLERGEQHGRDLDDWFQAEREVTTNLTGELHPARDARDRRTSGAASRISAISRASEF